MVGTPEEYQASGVLRMGRNTMMEYNAKKLLKKVEGYFTGEISKTELGRWANFAYYDLLKGSYIENEKIVIYPFLKVISTFHRMENDQEDVYPCTEEDVKMIRDILHGNKDFDFSVEMSIPIQVYSMFEEKHIFNKERLELFVKLRNILFLFFEQNNILSNEMIAQIESIISLKLQNKTVKDLLEEYIQRFLRVLFEDYSMEMALQKNLKLYALKSEQNIIVERLMSYLECYTGNRNFEVLVSYKEGESSIVINV